MPYKSFAVYNEQGIDRKEELIVEVGKLHLACLSCTSLNKVSAFEHFTYSIEEADDFAYLYNEIASLSLLMNPQRTVRCVYINNETGMLIPVSKFNKTIAAEYHHLIFGKSLHSLYFDSSGARDGWVNIFKMPEAYKTIFGAMGRPAYKHTFTSAVSAGVKQSGGQPAVFLQFYHKALIATLLKEDVLQVVQYFDYDTPEDVVYIVLNLARQYLLSAGELLVFVSGLIDLDFNIYRELIRYFSNVQVVKTDEAIPASDPAYPHHYFTPFFNLLQ